MQGSGNERPLEPRLGNPSRVADELFARWAAGSGLGEGPTGDHLGTVRLDGSPDLSSAPQLTEPRPALEGEAGGTGEPAVAAARPEHKKAGPSWRRRVAWCCLLAGCLLLPAPLLRFVGPGRPAKGPQGGAEKERLTGGSRAKAIDAIVVGDRVRAKHPQGEEDTALGEDVDPATWRRVDLRAAKRDGSWAEVVLLRPEAWLASQGARVGGALRVAVPECGIDGEAEVLAISPCPPIRPGAGRVVIGTFKHLSAQVVDLYIEGMGDPLGTTVNHRVWSEDRQRFVAAGELHPGERLRDSYATPRLQSLVSRSQPEVVYNIEVQGAHVYHVSHLGVLVHNGSLRPDGPRIGGVYVFFDVQDGGVEGKKGRVRAYIGHAQDFWDRVGGENEGPSNKHNNAIEALRREGTQLRLYEVPDAPSQTKGFMSTQEYLRFVEFKREWEAKGYQVDFVNAPRSPPRSERPGSAYEVGNRRSLWQGKSADPDKANTLRQTYTDKIQAKPELVRQLLDNKILTDDVVARPELLSKFQADLLMHGDQGRKLSDEKTAEWLKALRENRARQGHMKGTIYDCPG